MCPLLLRVFHKLGGHHRLEDFARVKGDEADEEVQIYTWPDATLRELSDLVKEVGFTACQPRCQPRYLYVDVNSRRTDPHAACRDAAGAVGPGEECEIHAVLDISMLYL